jgi:hypothetical protein
MVVLLGLVFAVVHFIAVVFALMYVLLAGMGSHGPTWPGRLAEFVLIVLGFPAHLVIANMGGTDSTFALLGAFAANSALWGSAFAVLMYFLGRRRGRARDHLREPEVKA